MPSTSCSSRPWLVSSFTATPPAVDAGCCSTMPSCASARICDEFKSVCMPASVPGRAVTGMFVMKLSAKHTQRPVLYILHFFKYISYV